MATKKTLEQLEAEAKRAEQHAKELRKQIQKQTQAEQAKQRAKLLDELVKTAEERRRKPEEYLRDATALYDGFRKLAERYGCTPGELWDYIRSDAQVLGYVMMHMPAPEEE